ncbi:MAG: diguanylate cyclase [Desulfobulbus sp.]
MTATNDRSTPLDPTSDTERGLIVVVDDSSTIRSILAKELREAGYQVETFNNGSEALAALCWMPRPPDLITLDIDMPGMDGFECCEQLRKLEADGRIGTPGAEIPVLFVSGRDTFENRVKGFRMGSLEFISKPFRRGDISVAVNRVLHSDLVFAGMTVLVVDDSVSVRRIVAGCLERLGLEILEAADGRNAYEILRARQSMVDMMIVDYNMPEMHGDELVFLVRQMPRAARLPILSLSGAGESESILSMFRAGASDYIIKPFIVEELLARVQVHLQLALYMRSLEDSNRELFDRAVNDALTGLRNKRYFQESFGEMFAQTVRSKGDLGCLFFDLDHFKQVNDNCGHAFGDYVLQTVGRLVKKNLRMGDLTARFGGEEFVVALPNTSLENSLVVAEKLRALVEGHDFTHQGTSWKVTISIGVASLRSGNPETAEAFVEMADQALYRAKRKGRNRVVGYEP